LASILISQKIPSIDDDGYNASVINPAQQPSMLPAQRIYSLFRYGEFLNQPGVGSALNITLRWLFYRLSHRNFSARKENLADILAVHRINASVQNAENRSVCPPLSVARLSKLGETIIEGLSAHPCGPRGRQKMHQRRRLTLQERNEAGAATRAQNPGKRVFVQEWTNADGKPIVLTMPAI
jgi:hypothetical protein